MSRNGAGVYTLPAGNPVVTGTTISSTWANNSLSDIATALTQSLAKDGQTTPTANIPMGSFKLTGLGAPTTAGDALAFGSPMGAISGTTGTFSGNVQMASANGGQLAGLRNKIINGDMRVAQRGTSLVIAAASSGYLLDRWLVNNNTNQSITVSQTTTTINSSDTAYRLRVVAAVAPTTGTVSIRQRIEDVSTLAGVTATLSAQVASADTSMVAETSLLQNFGSGGSTSVSTTPVSFSPTASYSKVSSTHAIPSTVGKTVGANNCLEWTMLLTLRSTNAFSLTEAQLEVGPVATPFEFRPIGMELALCQRYYYRITSDSAGSNFTSGAFVDSTTTSIGAIVFPVTMRTEVTALEQTGTAANYVVRFTGAGTAICNAVPTFQVGDVSGARVTFTTAAVLTAGQSVMLQSAVAAGIYLGWSAEL